MFDLNLTLKMPNLTFFLQLIKKIWELYQHILRQKKRKLLVLAYRYLFKTPCGKRVTIVSPNYFSSLSNDGETRHPILLLAEEDKNYDIKRNLLAQKKPHTSYGLKYHLLVREDNRFCLKHHLLSSQDKSYVLK